MAQILVLDNEPIQALLDPQHPKHRSAMAYLEVPAQRNRRKVGALSVIVPTTVRLGPSGNPIRYRQQAAHRRPRTRYQLG